MAQGEPRFSAEVIVPVVETVETAKGHRCPL